MPTPSFVTHDLSALTVLVVDDNPNMRRVIRAILVSLGVQFVFDVRSAAEAMQALCELPIDVIITDLNMKPVSGIELVRRVRTGADSPNPHVPIIMLTAHTDAHLVEEARDVGIDEFVAKPVSGQVLYERIAEITDNRRPFVRTETYVGPDRRRRNRPHTGRERRKPRPPREPGRK